MIGRRRPASFNAPKNNVLTYRGVNAVVESFWGSMQIELLNQKRWETRLELSLAMIDWIEEFYNQRRCHSTLANLSPIEFERRHQHLTAA